MQRHGGDGLGGNGDVGRAIEHHLAHLARIASEQAIAQVELLNRQLAAVRSQLEQLNAALASAETAARDKDLKLEELGRELNLALAARVQELARYRSEFFGRLQAVLGQRKDIQIVGDRFVFSSEVLFATASDEVSAEGMMQLTRLAETLKTLSAEIPTDLPWVLQVDGHRHAFPLQFKHFWPVRSAAAQCIRPAPSGRARPAPRRRVRARRADRDGCRSRR